MQSAADLATILGELVMAIVLAGGGVWGFFRFVRHRTLKRRLELEVSGELVRDGRRARLVVRSQARNIGLREVKLQREGTVIRIYAHELQSGAALQQSSEARWGWLGTWHVFADRELLEPSEPVEDQTLIELSSDAMEALSVELRVYSGAGKFWKATEVVIPGSRADNEDSNSTTGVQ